MANDVTVTFSNDGTAAHYVVDNTTLASTLSVATIIGDPDIVDNVTGGLLGDPYVVPESDDSGPGDGTVNADYTNSGSMDEAYLFMAEGWNLVKNISVVAEGDDSILFIADNFVHADMDFSGINNEIELRIYDVKRGNYITGDADDHIKITTATNSKGWSNLHQAQTGDGDDIVEIGRGDKTLEDTTIVGWTDGRKTYLEIDLGDGDDIFSSDDDVRSMDTIFGGKGNDSIYTAGGADVLEGGEDRGEIVDLGGGLYDLVSDGDLLWGGAEADIFRYATDDGFAFLGDGFDQILDFEDADILEMTLSKGTETVTTETVTVDHGITTTTGTMVSVDGVAAVYLHNFFNTAEIFV